MKECYVLTIIDLYKKKLSNENINKIAKLCSSVPSWRIIIEDKIIAKIDFVSKTEDEFETYITDIKNILNKNNCYVFVYDKNEFKPVTEKSEFDEEYFKIEQLTNYNEYLKIFVLYVFLFIVYSIYFS